MKTLKELKEAAKKKKLRWEINRIPSLGQVEIGIEYRNNIGHGGLFIRRTYIATLTMKYVSSGKLIIVSAGDKIRHFREGLM